MQFTTPGSFAHPDGDEPDATFDERVDRVLVVGLHDARLRALLATATGLSTDALQRLGVAAEMLRRTEGLEPAEHPAQL